MVLLFLWKHLLMFAEGTGRLDFGAKCSVAADKSKVVCLFEIWRSYLGNLAFSCMK